VAIKPLITWEDVQAKAPILSATELQKSYLDDLIVILRRMEKNTDITIQLHDYLNETIAAVSMNLQVIRDGIEINLIDFV